MSNKISWFDLPVIDLNRAIQFYSTVLDVEIKETFPGVAVISHSENEVSGCLFHDPEYKPSINGALLYFNVNGRLEDAVAQVEGLNGKILQAVHDIGPYGKRAIVIDSEGNRIALYAE